VSARLTGLLARVTLVGAVAGSATFAAPMVAPLIGPELATVLAASDPAMCNDEYAAFVAKPSISTAKAVGECEIDRRLEDLKDVRGRVASAPYLTSGERSTMTSRIDHDTSGLKTLRSHIANDSTLAALSDDLHAIVWDYRVYVLLIRQDWLTWASEAELAAVRALDAYDAHLTTWIAAAKAAGYDTAAVEADQHRLESDANAVQADVHGLPSTLLALTVAGYNAGTAGPTMDHAAQTLATDSSTLIDARQAAQQAAQDIKALGA